MDSKNSTITVCFEDQTVAIDEIIAKILERKFTVEKMVELPTEEGKSIGDTGPASSAPSPE